MVLSHLGYCYAALFSQLLFGLFTGVRVTKMRVKILVQYLGRLLAEVPPFPSAVGQAGKNKRRKAIRETQIKPCVMAKLIMKLLAGNEVRKAIIRIHM